MYSKVFFIGLLFVALAFGQRFDVLVIDPFEPATDVIVFVAAPDTVYPFSQETVTADSRILGGERDLSLVVSDATSGNVISTGVANGNWNAASPRGANGIITMQYDGTDGASTLTTTGLGGIDLTTSNADAFHFTIVTDIDTTYTIRVYGQAGGQSNYDIFVPRSSGANEYYAYYSDFTGNANFAAVGAIEIVIAGNRDVDTAIDLFATSADTPGTSATPSPSSSPGVQGFTWYTVDDDLGREPCEDDAEPKSYFVTDQNIIYYYFYRAYYEPVIIYNSAADVAPYLLGTAAAVILAAF